MEGCDEPQLHLQVGASLLGSNELQQVLVLHAWRAEDLPFALPRLLILRQGGSSVLPLGAPQQDSHQPPTYPSPCPVPSFPTSAAARHIWRTRPTATPEEADTSTPIYKWDPKPAWVKVWQSLTLTPTWTTEREDVLDTHLEWEDLYSHEVIHELSLPNAAKATPSLDLQQLQWLQAHQRGWGWRSGVLGKQGLKGVCPAVPPPCPAPTLTPAHLMDIHVAIGRLAMPIHPEGQQDNEGEAPNGQQRVSQYREQGGGCRGWLVRDWRTQGALCHTVRPFQHSSRSCSHSPLAPGCPT